MHAGAIGWFVTPFYEYVLGIAGSRVRGERFYGAYVCTG
ncbi:hypothetical protein DOT_3773 [Desulfosporosinus sp. OT]|nr:hypothetical protein DOT_3773 [Desulfosporosinus sp. OT]